MWRILHKFAVCVISNLRILPGKRGKVALLILIAKQLRNLAGAGATKTQVLSKKIQKKRVGYRTEMDNSG
ncbi:hypothetical protein [Escherichia coli]|uniref:hypothetical protein n=1 Tax=Escherichia coli TaxID=562 RepID=UPI00254C786A|nr:hypothetical protein [Escherichia coli]